MSMKSKCSREAEAEAVTFLNHEAEAEAKALALKAPGSIEGPNGQQSEYRVAALQAVSKHMSNNKRLKDSKRLKVNLSHHSQVPVISPALSEK